jgi:serine/threonine protein kinase
METSPISVGQMLAGKYRVERVLGEGGMGVVVEAFDTSLERRVAIKFLLSDFVNHPEATQRFMREARAAVKIQSEHVARVIDVSTLETGAPFMVMEFLQGSDLSQTIDARGPLAVEDTALYVIQACEALAEAHAHGIIHRDLKPANLFLSEQADGSRKIKVLDFGISKTLAATDPGLVGSLTRTASMMGSPLYMSPEQMRSARDVDHRTDIWALGVILYEALTGNPPFSGGSIPEISAKVLLDDPCPMQHKRQDLPPALVNATARAMQKQPEKRFANVGELALALLPFAPPSAGSNVERILRVLDTLGPSKSDALASVVASGLRSAESAPSGAPAPSGTADTVALGNRREGTLTDFGRTQNGRARSQGTRRRLWAAAAGLLSIGGLVGFFLRPAAPRDSEREALRDLAPATPAALPSGPPASAAAAPGPEIRIENSDAIDDEVNPTPPTPEASPPAPLPAPIAPPSPRPTATAAPAQATAAGREKPRLRAPVPTTPPHKPVIGSQAEENAHPGDFKAKFGSRK